VGVIMLHVRYPFIQVIYINIYYTIISRRTGISYIYITVKSTTNKNK